MMARHPNSQRFHDLLKLAGQTHDDKQVDYGAGDDPFRNVRASSEFGMAGSTGCFIRMNDKMQRLKAYCVNGSLKHEGVLDTLMDLAVYSLIAYVLFEEEQEALGADRFDVGEKDAQSVAVAELVEAAGVVFREASDDDPCTNPHCLIHGERP